MYILDPQVCWSILKLLWTVHPLDFHLSCCVSFLLLQLVLPLEAAAMLNNCCWVFLANTLRIWLFPVSELCISYKKKKDKSRVWAFPGSWQWQFLENEHLRSFKLVLPPPAAAHFHRYCDCEAVMVLGLPWGWGDEQIKKLQTSLLSARFRPFYKINIS